MLSLLFVTSLLAGPCDGLISINLSICQQKERLDAVPTCNKNEQRTTNQEIYCDLLEKKGSEHTAPDTSRKTLLQQDEMRKRLRGTVPTFTSPFRLREKRNLLTRRTRAKQVAPQKLMRRQDPKALKRRLKRVQRASASPKDHSGPLRVQSVKRRSYERVRERRNTRERQLRLYRARGKRVPVIR